MKKNIAKFALNLRHSRDEGEFGIRIRERTGNKMGYFRMQMTNLEQHLATVAKEEKTAEKHKAFREKEVSYYINVNQGTVALT